MANYGIYIPPFPTYPPIPTVQPGAVSTGTFSGTSGSYVSSSSNGPGPQCASWANKSYISSLAADVMGPLDGTANVATMASYAVPVPALSSYTSKQALALAVGAPSSTDWNSATSGHIGLTSLAKAVPNSCFKFMVGELGGRYNVGGVSLENVNARVALTLNLPAEAAPLPGRLIAAITNVTPANSFYPGFQQLVLTITKTGSPPVSKTYTDYTTFKNDALNGVIDLGTLTTLTPTSVTISVRQTLANSRQGVFFKVVLFDPPAPSGADAAPAPTGPAEGNGAGRNLLNSAGTSADLVVRHESDFTLLLADIAPGLIVVACLALVAGARALASRKASDASAR
jgi:hypothetical protein